MRKLKTLLILMFAASLSLTLFACGGGNKDKDKDGSGTLYRLSGDEEIVLDDSTDQNAWNTYLQSYQFTGQTDEGDRIKIKGSDCDVTHNIDFATPDRYVATFKPKENNPDGLTLDVNVVITHTWVDGDEDGVQVCSKDGAKLTTKDEDVVMHYGGFHYGTGDGPLGSVPEIGTVLPKITLNAEEAEALGLNAEAGNGAVFNNDAGITGKDSSGRITNFGVDGRNGKTVPTITAGDLTPGMSITIEGYAKTDAGWDMDNPTGPWNVKNGNWNAPSYGIADPYSTLSSTNNVGGIDVGAAVIVRSEGWVLYNGIGDANSVNVLGGLPAFVEGTGAYGKESGSTDTANYGSHTSDNGEKWPTNFDPAKRPAFTSADWKTWWVYSEGQDRHSLDSYGTQPAVTDDNPDTRSTYVPVRVTWTYRTYGEGAGKVGIITIESEYLEEETVLRSYIKVPDPTRGSFRTIIHGDYSSLIITKSSYIEVETVTDMRISDQVQEGARKAYLAGEQIDAASVLKMEIKSEQNEDWHDGGIAVTNDMLYYYKGEGTTYEQATAAIDTAADWVAVEDKPLTTDMKYFKVVLVRGLDTFSAMVPDNMLSIVENNVAGAAGDAYAAGLDSHDPLASYTRSIGGSGAETYVSLAIDKAVFRTLPDGTFTALTDETGYYFATLRILGIAAFSGIEGEQQKDGTVGSDKYYYKYKTAENDVLLAIAIKQDMLGEELLIDGVQTTPIHIAFGENSVGFEVTSEAQYTPFKLNVGGEVTITYNGIGNEDYQIYAYYYNADGSAREIGRVWNSDIPDVDERNDQKVSEENPVAIGDGIQIIGYNKDDGTGAVTITYKFPAFNFETWASIPYIRLVTDSNKAAEDYIEYDFAFDNTAANHAANNIYFYEQSGKLYFVNLTKAAAGKDIDIATALAEEQACTVTINNGDTETARSCDLAYIYKGGNVVFARASYNDNEAYGIKNFVLGKGYGDYGLVVITSIDPAALGFTGDYGFQTGGDTGYWKYDADAQGEKFSHATISGTQTTLEEGDCYTKGIVATEVKDGGSTVFLGNYKEVGGKHIDEDGDNVCDLCGGSYHSNKALANGSWFPAGHLNEVLQEGDIIDITGVYKTGSSYANSISSFIEENGAQGRVSGTYCSTLDGYYYWQPTSNWLGTATIPYADVEGFTEGSKAMGNSLITEEHPSNTINGWTNAQGVTIDETNFGAAMEGGTFRYTVSYIDGVITTRVRLYVKGVEVNGEAFFDFENTLQTATNGTYNLFMFFKQGGTAGELVDNELIYVRSTVNKSVISSVAGADVTVPDSGAGTKHNASTATFATDGFDEDGNAKITVTGMASKDTAHYLAFKITFSQALASTTAATLFRKDGTTAFAGYYADFNDDMTELSIYVPVEATTGGFYIKLTNAEAATLQSNIYVDLTALAVSDVGAVLTDTALTLDETTFTIQYTGIDGTEVLTIGTWSKALNAISTSAPEEITGTNLTVKANAEVSGNAITLTFTKAAADLTKAIPSYEIKLMKDGGLVASTMVAPATKPASGDQRIGESVWYARAKDTKLYLYANNTTNVGSLPFNVNAGHATLDEAPEMLGVADLAFKVEGGVVKFKQYNALNAAITTVYTDATTSLTVFIIDLTKLGVTAETSYGFAIEEDAEACDDALYIVTEGSITKGSGIDQTDPVTVQAHTKENNLIKARCAQGDAQTSPYYGYVTVTGHTFPEEGGACSTEGNCGVTGWTKSGVVVGKADNSVAVTYEDGAEKAYNPAGANNYNVIVKGQKIVATGHMTAVATQNDAGVAALLFEDANYVNDKYFRMDDWINGTAWKPGDANSKTYTDETAHFNFKITRTAQSGLSYEARNAIKADAMLVLTWDWTTDAKIVIKYEVTDFSGKSFWAQFDVEAPDGKALGDKYSIGIIPVSGSFTGEIVATAEASKVEAGSCNPGRGVAKTDPDYSENQNPSVENPIVIGKDDMSNGYPGLTPVWYGKIEKGNRYVYSGTQTSKAALDERGDPQNYMSLFAYIFSGLNPAGLFRFDNWILDAGNVGAGADLSKAEDWATIGINTTTDWNTMYKSLNGTFTVTFDWTDPTVIKLTMYSKGTTEGECTAVYTIRAASGKELKSYYNIGFAAESSQAKITSFVKDSEKAPVVPPVVSDQQNTFTVGAENCTFGFTHITPTWIGNPIKSGETITITGTLKSKGEHAWEVPIAYLMSSKENNSSFRTDGFNNHGDEFMAAEKVNVVVTPGISGADSNYQGDGAASGEVNTDFLNGIKAGDVTFTLTYNWTNAEQIVITATFEKGGMTTVTTTFTITAVDEFAEQYWIGLGGENIWLQVSSVVNSGN